MSGSVTSSSSVEQPATARAPTATAASNALARQRRAVHQSAMGEIVIGRVILEPKGETE
jgi:hypothetical protein